MIKYCTLERDRKIAELMDKKEKSAKEVRAILYRRGIVVSLWTIYKAREKFPKISKKILIQVWG